MTVFSKVDRHTREANIESSYTSGTLRIIISCLAMKFK